MIKLKSDDPSEREQVRRQLRRVRQMPIDDLPITRPLELLRPPYAGYVMEYLNGMVPLSKLRFPPRGDIKNWYQETGSLKRRLLILAKCADILFKLQSKGLIYGDLSLNNVFVSESTKHTQVYLIDIDNLSYETDHSRPITYTPFYGAPELVRKECGIDSITDAYSFAVIAFEVLTLVHPLIGDWVDNGDPNLESKALAGELPWAFHLTDKRNATSRTGLKEITLSKGLFSLFNNVFDDGMLERDKRPGIVEWVNALYKAYQFVLTCPRCKGSYYIDQEKCPWCQANKPDYWAIIVDFDTLIDDSDYRIKKTLTGYCLEYRTPIVLTRRNIMDDKGENADKPIMEIETDGKRVFVRCFDEDDYWAIATDSSEQNNNEYSRKERIGSAKKGYSSNWQFHLGQLDRPHYIIRISTGSK
ncbi:serine/threonine protein kinase [Chloroflexota bacterium]